MLLLKELRENNHQPNDTVGFIFLKQIPVDDRLRAKVELLAYHSYQDCTP